MSAVKRIAGVNDWATSYPDTGGVLDRVDSKMVVLHTLATTPLE